MSVLSDNSILEAQDVGRILVDPFCPTHVQPASLDLRLSSSFIRSRFFGFFKRKVHQEKPFWLWPWEFMLADTMEWIELSNDLSGVVSGRSSVGRLAIQTENAGWVDPGFKGTLTLEILNHDWLPKRIYPGMRIAQISFHELDRPCDYPYGHTIRNSKYQLQSGATESRLRLDEEVAAVA